MTPNISDTAMVLAAGEGKRLRPLTLTKPKPLFEVGGRTMLDHSIDKLVAAGLQRVVVNCFYLADQIEAHLKNRRDIEIIISRETELLETGGGIKNALHHFGGKPFLTMNADLPWNDAETPSVAQMMEKWNPEQMDALLLVMPTKAARGFTDKGDFMIEPNGRLWRKDSEPPRPVVWIGTQIIKPEPFAQEKESFFSTNVVFHKMEEAQRLFGFIHQGTCFHAGTPEDLAEANRLLASGEGWAVT